MSFSVTLAKQEFTPAGHCFIIHLPGGGQLTVSHRRRCEYQRIVTETKSRWLSRYSHSLRWLIVLVKLHRWLFEKIKQNCSICDSETSTNLTAILKTESCHCYNHLAVIIAREKRWAGKWVESVSAKHAGAPLGDAFYVRIVSPVISAPLHTAIRFKHFVLSQIAFLAVDFDNGVPNTRPSMLCAYRCDPISRAT